MTDDDLDWQAKFAKITEHPEMQVVEERVAAQHPRVTAWADEDSITIKLIEDRGLLAMNLPLEVLQAIVSAAAHVSDHQCQPSALWLNEMMGAIVQAVYAGLEGSDLLPNDDVDDD